MIIFNHFPRKDDNKLAHDFYDNHMQKIQNNELLEIISTQSYTQVVTAR